MKLWAMVAAPVLLIGAAPAPAGGTKPDLRCFIALTILADTADGETKEAAMAATLYFLGRLDGRTPGLDIEAAVAAEAASLTDDEIDLLLKSCGETLKGRGQYLIRVGEALEKSGK